MSKGSIFYKFLFSYIAVGLLVILSSGVVLYYLNVTALHSEIRNTQYSSVTQAIDRIDYMLEAMSNVANHFSGSELRRQLSDEGAGNNGGFIISQLQSYEPNLPEPMRLMLYMRGGTEVYFSDSEYPYSTFKETVNADLNMSKLFTVLNSSNYATPVRILQKSDAADESALSLAFVYPIPYMNIVPDISLAFFIDSADFTALFNNYLGNSKRNIYLLDRSYQIIYQNESDALSKNELKQIIGLKGTGVTENALDGRNDVVMRTISKNSGYTLITTMDEREFFSEVSFMRTVVTVCIFLFGALTLGLAFLFAIHSYRPIRILMNITGREKEKKENEFEFLRSYIHQTHHLNHELGAMLEKQRPYIAHVCIESLLRGKEEGTELAFQMQCANISFPHPFFQVMIISPVEKNNAGEKLQRILAVCEQTSFEGYVLFCTENIMEKQISVICNCGGGDGAADAAEKMQKDIAGYDINTSIGIGSVQNSIGEIHHSYMEAMAVVKEYLPNRPGDVLCFINIPSGDSIDYSFSFSEQSLLQQALRHGDKIVALQTLGDMVQRIAKAGGSVLITQHLCLDIVHTLIQMMAYSGDGSYKTELRNLREFTNLEDFHARAVQVIEKICAHNESVLEQKNTAFSTALIRYVNENYRDAGLSLEQMASHFDLSSGYLSRFFKQSTGQNFIQYLTKLRLDYVRDKLINTDMQIKEIVTGAGYLDIASFTRKFKTLEGLTPGQFRTRARE